MGAAWGSGESVSSCAWEHAHQGTFACMRATPEYAMCTHAPLTAVAVFAALDHRQVDGSGSAQTNCACEAVGGIIVVAACLHACMCMWLHARACACVLRYTPAGPPPKSSNGCYYYRTHTGWQRRARGSPVVRASPGLWQMCRTSCLAPSCSTCCSSSSAHISCSSSSTTEPCMVVYVWLAS